MMRCPLPIDWLEYLEGTGSSDLALHLSECRPCQILLDRLRQELTCAEYLDVLTAIISPQKCLAQTQISLVGWSVERKIKLIR